MQKFSAAMSAIDAVHAEDPDAECGRPKELVYAERMSAWLAKLAPQASELLKLATRCQHLRRWAIPRTSYPDGKIGYLGWRKQESLAHAALAGKILAGAGYDAEAVKRVQSLIKKERIKHDPEAQVLEDASCLVFLEHEFVPFAAKHPDDKLIDILRKTWPKMSPQAQQEALGLELPAPLRALVEKALA
ncbi:MAG TPA: DUF4202 domain-containing protein [Burkholderiales bacterium]|nr:DUF4202 domain-containing protein [Burkholderiales bacterium]